ncbi:paired amphipathic helix protein Sin3b-like [Planococcus citri]|uniref:paired amphipathic helix protein Sin3b-like n=1 Tax=Planococcus citri TaxID=170843 RepID=UPI0031F83D08
MPQLGNTATQYSVDSTSPLLNFSSLMPTLTGHEKNTNPNVIPVGSSPVHSGIHGVPLQHSLPPIRNKMHASVVPSNTGQQSSQNFQRLKVEDALSYLDQVKYKFGSQPQVYNDFLDIMKEFKSQSIDTPGVITRVSNLFKGHPELIVGFNTFLPPGYKIEVQSSDSGGYSFQVSVSIQSPSSSTSTLVPSTHTVLHTSTVSNITSTVTTTASPLLTGSTLSIVTPVLSAPITITSGSGSSGGNGSSIPIPNSVTNNNVQTTPNNVAPTNSIPSPKFNQNQAHQAVTQALIQVESGMANQPVPQNQPVEFNHAINYVNKIKNRFQGQPDKYKRFLEILHTYQKEQRNLKENQVTCPGSGKTLTETEVYSQVAKLFENQEDLLAEFGQFLPDASSHQSTFNMKNNDHSFNSRKPPVNAKPSFNNTVVSNNCTSSNSTKFTNNNTVPSVTSTTNSGLLKRSSSMSNSHSSVSSMQPVVKKHKSPSSLRDVSVTEAGKYGTLNDFAFFDRIRKTIHNNEMYRNFLRCLMIFNNEIINESELLQLTTPFLNSHPELLRWFKEFIGQTDAPPVPTTNNYKEEQKTSNQVQHSFLDQVHNNAVRSENCIDIDYSTCKRIGASYCAVPEHFDPPKCSGRTDLCREVLNDTWVSFPTWSEDSTFVSSRKTQYEEYIYRCEDERFELDVVIETNAATVRVFDGVQKKLSRLSPEEIAKYRLDDCLGGTSPSIHQRAIKRIYGDKAQDIIEGLKKNPAAAIPVVLKRLKAKEEEWREAQKGFNKIWREQNEKFYLKSLDHQGMNFKQNDMKYLRSKSLMNEIEALFDDRHEHADENTPPASGPHMVLPYRDKSVLDDAANLLIHHVKRQTGIHKEDKQKIKLLIRQFIPDLFHHPRQELSDDEREELEEKTLKKASPTEELDKEEDPVKTPTSVDKNDINAENVKIPFHAVSCHPDEYYTLFFADNHWYLFLRLHQILCDRLSKMYEKANIIAKQESSGKENRKESTAISLRLKPKPEIEVEEYYTAMLDMVKNVLDGNMDSNTYEDTLREMFGIHAYVAFTLDKVVSHAVRQLQYLVTDETCQDCYDLYIKESKKKGTGGPCITAYQRTTAEANYQKKIESMSMESCFKIFIYKIDCKITIECLDTDGDNEDNQENEKWNNFQENENRSETFK